MVLGSLDSIGQLYRLEIRSALRERTIIVNSILMPILLYPFMLWAVFTGVMFVQGQTEGFVSRVVVVGVGEHERQLVKLLELDERFELHIRPTEVAAAMEQLGDGTLDAHGAHAVRGQRHGSPHLDTRVDLVNGASPRVTPTLLLSSSSPASAARCAHPA